MAPVLGFLAMAVACVPARRQPRRPGRRGRRHLHQDPARGWCWSSSSSGWRSPPCLRSSAPDRYARIGQFELRTRDPDAPTRQEPLHDRRRGPGRHHRVAAPRSNRSPPTRSPPPSTLLRDGQDLGPTARFVFVTLHEPTKARLLAWSPDDAPLPREAHLVLYERGERTTYEAVVSLTDRSVVSWSTDPGRAGADHGRGVHRLRGRSCRPTRAGRRPCASAASRTSR